MGGMRCGLLAQCLFRIAPDRNEDDDEGVVAMAEGIR